APAVNETPFSVEEEGVRRAYGLEALGHLRVVVFQIREVESHTLGTHGHLRNGVWGRKERVVGINGDDLDPARTPFSLKRDQPVFVGPHSRTTVSDEYDDCRR